jgi:hypothetical protein
MDRHYRVRYHDKGLGSTTYGVVDSYCPEAKELPKGQVLVEHAIYPKRIVVEESTLVDVPLAWGGEYDFYVSLMQDLHEILADRLGYEKLKPGHQFSMSVGDGAAHYVVTKVRQATCTVEWRGFNGDRYVDRVFGWGGSFRRRDVEPLVGIGHQPFSSLLDPDRVKTLEGEIGQKMIGFQRTWKAPQELLAMYSQIV